MDTPRVSYIAGFATDRLKLFEQLRDTIAWDERMRARKTASFGVPYNYSGMTYPACDMPPQLAELVDRIEREVGMRANNCLVNYYPDGGSRMGFHSDATDGLRDSSGIAIVSLGAERTLTFRRKSDHEVTEQFVLKAGSLLFMPLAVQDDWQHALLKSETADGRISLTFREIVNVA